MKPTSLIELAANRKPAEELLADIKSDDLSTSLRAGQRLARSAKEAQLNLPDYLNLAVDVDKGDFSGEKDLSGFEAALSFLNLPIKNDFRHGVVLQAAAETFQTFPGSRALFPPVIDAMVQWNYRQNSAENVEALIGNSRTINGPEMITTVVDDKAEDYQGYGPIPELANIPVRSIRMGEKAVSLFKFGRALRMSYEFERRISIDVLTPYAARIQREIEISKVAAATNLLVNGDGTSGAASVTTATALAGGMPDGPVVVAGKLDWEVLLAWLVQQAQAGTPVDTVVGNWDLALAWQRMFATPMAGSQSAGQVLGEAGVNAGSALAPAFPVNITFAVSSSAPANQLIGFSKADTLEELVENGSDIEESDRAIMNQSVRYTKTENRGYKLTHGDTRSILSLT